MTHARHARAHLPWSPDAARAGTAGSFSRLVLRRRGLLGEHLAPFEPPHPAPRRARRVPRAARAACRCPRRRHGRRGGAMGRRARLRGSEGPALRAARGTAVSQFLHSLPTHTLESCVMRVRCVKTLVRSLVVLASQWLKYVRFSINVHLHSLLPPCAWRTPTRDTSVVRERRRVDEPIERERQRGPSERLSDTLITLAQFK